MPSYRPPSEGSANVGLFNSFDLTISELLVRVYINICRHGGTVAIFTLTVTNTCIGCQNTCRITFGCACRPCVDPALGLGPATNTVYQLGAGQISIIGPPGGIVGDIWDNKGKLSILGSEYASGTIHLGAGATFANSSSGSIGPVSAAAAQTPPTPEAVRAARVFTLNQSRVSLIERRADAIYPRVFDFKYAICSDDDRSSCRQR